MHQQTVHYIAWVCYVRIWWELGELEQISRVSRCDLWLIRIRRVPEQS